MISYAQCAEDVLLSRLFDPGHRGFFIDVGANHPQAGSVTAHFYDQGWRGINVEPSCIFGELTQARRRDLNLQMAVSNRNGTALFHEFPDAPGLSTFGADLAERTTAELGLRCVKRTIPVVTLAEICREHAPGAIDFLSVDVEGHEREVLEGADWKAHRPRVVVIEAVHPNTPIGAHDKWEDILLSAAYCFAYFNGVNRFYVREEDRELIPRLAVPPNCFDNFIPYALHTSRARTHELELQLETLEQIGPVSGALARRLSRIEQRHPRLSGWLLRLSRKLARRAA